MRRSIFTGIATAVLAILLAPLTVPRPAAAAPVGDWLRNGGSSLCLDGSVSQGVRMTTCSTSSAYQRWTRTWYGGSTQWFMLKNAADTSLCLDGTVSSGARMLPCNENVWQLWYQPVFPHLTNAAYGFANALDGSASQGVRMNVYSDTSTYQIWRFVAV